MVFRRFEVIALISTLLLSFCVLFMGAVAAQVDLSEPLTESAAQSARLTEASLVRHQVISRSVALISSEIAGRVLEMPVKDGGRFAQGDVLASFDCDLHRARLAKSRAQQTEFQKTLEVSRQLSRLGSSTGLELDVAEARLAGAQADVALMQALVRRCRISAPFSGRVVRWHVHPHEYVGEGQPIIEIIDDAHLDVELIVPSAWLGRLKIGMTFEVGLDELGQRYTATISRIGARIDPVSQSIKIVATLPKGADGALAGMSGTATFDWQP